MTSSLMRAAVLTLHGSPLQSRPGRDRFWSASKASAANPLDLNIDVTGRVEHVGSGVAALKPGDEV